MTSGESLTYHFIPIIYTPDLQCFPCILSWNLWSFVPLFWMKIYEAHRDISLVIHDTHSCSSNLQFCPGVLSNGASNVCFDSAWFRQGAPRISSCIIDLLAILRMSKYLINWLDGKDNAKLPRISKECRKKFLKAHCHFSSVFPWRLWTLK